MRSALWIAACTLVQLLLQLWIQIWIARQFGAAAAVDALQAAMAPPVVLSSLVAGSLGYAFVPSFVRLYQAAKQDPERNAAAWELASTMLALISFGALIIAAAGWWGASRFVSWLYSGFSVEQQALTARLWRILIWLTVTGSMISVLQAIHQGRQRFFLPAISGVLGIGYTLVHCLLRGSTIDELAWSILIGAVVAVAVQLWPVIHQGRCSWVGVQSTAHTFWLMVPLLVGMAYTKLDPLIDRMIASSLPTGAISQLGYANRIATALLTISVSSLSLVAFPRLSAAAVSGDPRQLSQQLGVCLAWVLRIIIPLIIGCTLFANPIVHDLFQRGAFTAQDTEHVARLLMLSSGFLAGAALGELISKGFYALNDTRTPTLIGAIGLTIGFVLKLILVRSWGVNAIMLASAVYFLGSAVAMLYLLARRVGNDFLRPLPVASLASLAGSVPAAITAALMLWYVPQAGIWLAGPLAGLSYFAALFLVEKYQGTDLRQW